MNSNIKRASLLLSLYSAEDKEWILDNLRKHNLDESLGKIGGFREAENDLFNDRLLLMAEQIKYSDDFQRCLKNITDIDNLDHKTVKRLTNDEPDWVISAILSFYNWSWKRKYLNSINLYKRYRLYKFKQTVLPSLSYKVKETLVEGMACRIA